MTGTFFECDACGRLDKNPAIDENVGLPYKWISIKLRVPDMEEYSGFYWDEFHACCHECAVKVIEAKKKDEEEYNSAYIR